MKNQIFLINQATGPLFIDMANAFLSKYKEVILITGKVMPTYSELDPNINIIFKKKLKTGNSISRIYSWLMFFLQSLLYILIKNNPAKILLVSNPPLLPFVGLFLNSIKRIKYDVLLYDIYPNALLNFGYLRKNSFIYKLWNKTNEKVYRNADRLFTISELMKNTISLASYKKHIEVIYPWADNSFIQPINKNNNWFAKQHNLLNKKVVLYSGNMGITHDLMIILKVAKELKERKNTDYHFLFIGGGSQLKDLVNFKEKYCLVNVSFLPYQKANVLPYSFASADYGVVSLAAGADGLSIPSKMFYFLAAGCCILSISEKGSEIGNLVKKHKLGVSIEPNNVRGLVIFY